jgi:hypothetical protein
MCGLLVFLEYKFFHLVAGNTEFLGVGGIHGIVEANPEAARDYENSHNQETERILCRR